MTTQALHFPGSALVYADRPTNDTVLDAPALGVLVIRFRIKFATSGGIWLSKEVEPASNGYFFTWPGGSAPIRFWDGSGYVDMTYGGAPTLATGDWYEVVTRIDQRSGARLQDCWLNGHKGSVYTSATLVSVAATQLILGHRIDGGGASSGFDLQEVGFWNTYMTDDQCAGMYGGGVAPESCYRYPTGLQAYYPLNGDLLDWSDGLGGGALPLTGHGGIGYATGTTIFAQPPYAPPVGVPSTSASPTTGSALGTAQPVTVTFSDTVGLGLNVLWAEYPSRPDLPGELVYDGTDFGPLYSGSSIDGSSTSKALVVRRDGGWPAPPRLHPRMCNSTGVQGS
jgi:hypothetical protein